MFVAKQVHKKLETFKIPYSVRKKTGKKKIERVFRDVEELPIGSDLGNNITTALSESEYLVVICSKETPKSYWVNQEIETFIKLKGNKNILAVLIDGEPNEAFPKQLLFDDNGNPIEPLAADVRGASKKEINKKLKTEIIRLAAQIIGCTYDELKQRHKERRLRKIAALTSIIAFLSICFGIYSVHNYITIQKNYRTKLINQSKYLADTSLTLLDEGDRITAGLIAMEALPYSSDRPLVSSAQFALGKALHSYADGTKLLTDRLLKHDLLVEKIKYSEDGAKLISIDVGGNVYIWNVDNGKLELKVVPEITDYGSSEIVLDAMLTKDNILIIATINSIKAVDLEGNVVWCEETNESYIEFVFDISNGMAAGISNDTIDIWNVFNEELVGTVSNEEKDFNFTNTGVFNSTGDKLAIAYYSDDEYESNGIISVISLDDFKVKTFDTAYPYIMNINFSNNEDIIVLSHENIDYSDSYNNDIKLSLENINSDNGKIIWSNEFISTSYELTDAFSDIKARSYELKSNEQKEIIITINNTVYTINEADGGIKSKITTSKRITSTLLSTSTEMGYIVDSEGVLGFYDMTNGMHYSGADVDMNRSVVDVTIKNGVLAAKIYSSPDVLLMKYHEGYGMERLGEYEDYVIRMDYSPNEAIYVVSSTDYYFYSTENNELIMQYELYNDYYAEKSCFVNDEIYAVFFNEGVVNFINVYKDEIDIIHIGDPNNIYEWVISDNSMFAIAYTYSEYVILDLNEQEVINEGKINSNIYDAVISNDGEIACFCCENNEIIKLEISDNITTSINNYTFLFNNIYGDVLALSSDGKYLAVNCADNNLRILNTENFEMITEVEYVGHDQSYIQFISNDNKILLQGDTFYYSIFDLDKNEYIYISDNQYNSIEKILTSSDNNTIAVLTTVDMCIMSKNDYEPIAEVQNGVLYMPNTGLVFTKSNDVIYKFPYLDLDKLFELAEKEFGEVRLSKWERIQYNID